MLDLDRQNTGKATVLGDAARVLRDLITQVESLRQEQSALVSERQYVSSEKNELQEENSSLKSQISELQTELCARMRSSSLSQTSIGMSDPATHQQMQMWSSIPHLSSVAMAARPASAASPLHGQEGYSADAGQAGYAPQPQPRELQLFPGSSASSSPERERSSRLGSGQATPPSLTDSLPGQLCLSLLQPSQEASGGGGGGVMSRSREERRDG
ncbi:Transcription factor bHLH47 [Zea mays]|nr:Transcription factor bHLH47 [Zea mays]